MSTYHDHRWTFSEFAGHLKRLSETPRPFFEVAFKTFLAEFTFYAVDINDTLDNHLKDVFQISINSPFAGALPEAILQAHWDKDEVMSLPNDLSKLSDSHFATISAYLHRIDTKPIVPPPDLSFEAVIRNLEAVMNPSLSLSDALETLKFLPSLDDNAIHWAFRILTNNVLKEMKADRPKISDYLSYEVIRRRSKQNYDDVIGSPQAPMLLTKTSTNPNDYVDKIRKYCGDAFYMETKYDGERLHVHKMRNHYKFFSRKGIDYSHKLGTDSSKEFAAKINGLFIDQVTHVVLDCELLVWDRVTKKLVGKNEKASDGKIYDVKNLLESRDDDTVAVNRTLCVFDVLHLNGTDLLEWTLEARIRLLKSLFKPEALTADTLFLTEHTLTTKRQQFLDYYNNAMKERLEGVVVKSLYSTYRIGSRAQQNGWFKVKPDYSASNTLDLAIVAVREKNTRILAFEVAALVSKNPLLFKIVGSVTPFIKRLDKQRLIGLLKRETGDFLDNRCPDWVQRPLTMDKNIRFVHLKCIEVVEVRASGLMRGSLRFPSIVCVRGDKEVLDIDTVKDVEEYEDNLRKAIETNRTDESDTTTIRLSRKRRLETIPSQFRKYDNDPQSQSPDVPVVCPINVTTVSRAQMEELSQLGLSFCPNFTKTTSVVVTDQPNAFKVKSAINQNLCHVIRADWLKRCIDEAAIVEWKEREVIFSSDNATFNLLEDVREKDYQPFSFDEAVEADSDVSEGEFNFGDELDEVPAEE
uniref:DNA ligase IV n=1 Tax=Panagrellus redivivus TaxID=6233 RepID=A0A7E4WBK9_PANRE